MNNSDRKWKHRVLPLFAALSLAVGTAAETKPELRASSVLFHEFETVFYSRSESLSDYPGAYRRLSGENANLFRIPFWYLLEGLDSLGKGTSGEMLRRAEVVLVGAKDFRGPDKGIGPVRSHVCYVVVVRKGSELDLRKYLHSTSMKLVSGIQVFNWSARIGEFGDENPDKPTLFFAAQINTTFILVSNDLNELQRVARRLKSSALENGMLSGIRDSESITRQKYWGYRRYRHDNVVDRLAAGMNDVGRDVEELVVFVDFEKKSCTVKFLTSPIVGRTPEAINAMNFIPRLRPVGPRIWQSIYHFPDEYTLERTHFIMGLLGFGSYL